MENVRIDPQLQTIIPPLAQDEFNRLEANILEDGGVREPIIVWIDTIVDGHNRWRIIQEHPYLPYKVKYMDFPDIWAAIVWMCHNQLGRRNVSDAQKTVLIGEAYEAEKKTRGGDTGTEHTRRFYRVGGRQILEAIRMADTVGYFIKQHAIPKNANNNTKRSYKRSAEKFQNFCRQVAHINLKQMRNDNAVAVAAIQAYSDALQNEGKSPDTIHTYLAPVCKAFEIPMNDILNPRRRAGKITRSGRDKDGGKLRNVRGTREAAMERYAQSVALADVTGIRASELAHLTVANLAEDESGHLCVEVDRGKGGKHQLQRILPAHQETVRQIFAHASSTGGGKVLGKSEINKNIDYYGRRAIVAQEAYRYYLTRLQG